MNSCTMSSWELYEEKSTEASLPCTLQSVDSPLAILWKQSTEIFSRSRFDRFPLYLLQFSAYYDVETACIHFSNITSHK